VQTASVVERGAAPWASAHRQVRVYCHRVLASTAEDGVLIPSVDRPLFGAVTSGFFVTEMTGIEAQAAGELDGHHVGRRRVVHAPRLLIDWSAENLHAQQSHANLSLPCRALPYPTGIGDQACRSCFSRKNRGSGRWSSLRPLLFLFAFASALLPQQGPRQLGSRTWSFDEPRERSRCASRAAS
jgi:hypothetical protein